jgi:hypothetical protein
MDCKASRNASNCFGIAISCILYAWLWPIGDNNNDFWGIWYHLQQFLAPSFQICGFWHRMKSKEPCSPSNCLRIVIFHILYEQSWHTLTTDNDFWGWMIPVKGIHCVIIAVQPVNAKTEFIIIHVLHYRIACRLSYYISYMHGNGISGILIPTFGYISYHSWQFLSLEFWRCKFQQKTYSK